jgi:heme/copper-type cytochrome/quinol oxidase subunit 3
MNETPRLPVDPLPEPPEVHERNLWLAARVLAGATIMFFLAFIFAYFYLRSLNTHGMWHPANVDPPQAYGAVIVILFAGSAGLLAYAADAARRGRGWLPAAGLSLLLGLAGCVVQTFEYAHIGFGPQSGGYASVFMGWTLLFVVLVLPAMFWVEVLIAEGLRNRGSSGVRAPAGLGDAAFYWGLLAGIGVLAWFILYVI